ncbi:MAG TPA: NUDIX domain-containing protein [Polyangiales bacterium]|nr:NUDIX domain-containing protein [Polyangiales bacterium]
MSAEEWIDVVDEDDRVIGRTTRAQMRRDNILHRNVAILCLNRERRIYVHRRTATKDLYPSLYDMFTAGVVGAGESYEQAALRELEEELGIRGVVPQLLFQHRYEGEHSRTHSRVFRVEWDGPIVHQPTEVAWGGFRTRSELLSNRERFAFVPDGLELFTRYVAEFPND